ncbi:hypothetical protein FJ959_09080 [Mesorhizobium sp. B2-2-4]|uniref:RNA ligase n=1 Tax=unclassified Mesorhizobium TaxID=325217 RepID=UPI0011293ECF|nr:MULTISPECIES: RNA ligase [unclassified Mesorhizobium]TPM59014.1 hypothetical protein FJ959_09080 [Mesorhizobium sp. B2-2-4]TPM67499.1 hypothetical protein FJ965_10220 [Mesorhizobium sp. B2-2-1]
MTHFPINHINDVLPHIEGRPDFVVAHKDGYSVIDYVFAGVDTFDHPARIECRGLKFTPDGRILSRPLHKFMNIGQTPDTQPDKIDFGQPHTIMDKLDGSMIHPAIVDGEVVLMTRMGRTDVARKAERHLTDRVRASCFGLLEDGVTPIFEWTAPDNRIVVRYDESALTILALRDNRTGYYWTMEWVRKAAKDMKVPAVRTHDSTYASATDFLAYARAIQGAEGFVVRFDSGLWVKAKGEDYVLKHKAKDSILQEKNILALVLSGGLDDVLPLLDEPDANAAREYAAAVDAGIAETADELEHRVAANNNLPQKEFALQFASELPALLQASAYRVRRGDPARDVIRARIAANTNSQSQVDANRVLHGATWRIS